MSLVKEISIGGKTISFEFQKFAKQANGSVMVTCGETQILVTVCASDEAKPDQDFFPLTVDYVEKQYAAGRIPGGYLKRETRPGSLEMLNARVIDRPLRPCFPEAYLCDTTITCMVVSYDGVNHPAPLGLIGASCALMISDIPFNGPVASLRVGLKNGEYILNPPATEESELDLNIAARPGAVLMVEAGANFLSEQQMLDAINFAHKAMQPIFDLQLEIQKEIGVSKRALVVDETETELKQQVDKVGRSLVKAAYLIKDKAQRNNALKEAKKEIQASLNAEGDATLSKKISKCYEDLKYNYVRRMVLDTKKRIDDRSLSDIRKITCEAHLIKRAHGSALFTRGETQALAVVTLGGADDSQYVDSIIAKENSKTRFMLHYNFPPFSVGESRPARAPGRREIGHGALAERALTRVLPDEQTFGYTIRLVSEILESNGSSSMATVCGGTMALLDAGVPIKETVAGIAMGLIIEGGEYVVLSDILGDEDHLGDMDFKVCGSKSGITALQMDVKVDGISSEIMAKALVQAKQGREHILNIMDKTIIEPHALSEYAPRIYQFKIPENKIKDLIGPGGKTIKALVAETGVKIDIGDHGMVSIVSSDSASAELAKSRIRMITSEPEVGSVYLGKVIKIMDFGAFIEIKPGSEGLCHISQLDHKRIERTEDVLTEGEEVLVKVIDIDRSGKIKLSRKEALGQKPN
ncbi:MAG: polyribonucleotide nucleotidyltransferase [Oligoflexales bacterium]|nr:polyribonucleotide nucleotidyltransferase [Oligoflexales bacterium]